MEVKIALNPKTVSYVINFTVLDDSTFLPITGVSILGLETGADMTDADGVATVKVPGPGDYTLGLAMTGYDTAYVSATMPDEGGLRNGHDDCSRRVQDRRGRSFIVHLAIG